MNIAHRSLTKEEEWVLCYEGFVKIFIFAFMLNKYYTFPEKINVT